MSWALLRPSSSMRSWIEVVESLDGLTLDIMLII